MVKKPDKDEKFEQTLKDFAKIWNNARSYPANYDLERVLGCKIGKIRKKTHKYRKYCTENPKKHMPELIWRKSITGGVIPVPEGVIRQLDPFRVDIKKLKDAKGVVVVSAQFGAALNKSFWESLKQYVEFRGYMLVVMPIKYGPIKTSNENGVRKLTSLFPEELKGYMIFDDVSLCHGSLNLNTARMRPTLVRFLTDQVCLMGGQVSQIFAAPKLELEHRPRIGHSLPKAIMTTGSVTYPNYSVDNLGQQDRTGEIAVSEHTFSAIVVEFSKKLFHFRQLHANKRGEFYDIDYSNGGALFFTSTGVERRPDDVDSIVLGDWHTGKTCPVVRKTTFGKGGLVKTTKPNNIVIHDFVDCDSVSHWEKNQSARRAFKAPLGWDSLEKELQAAVKELEWMHSKTQAKLHIIASNHNEYVTEYIETMRWVKDDANLDVGARLYTVMVEDLKKRAPVKVQAKPIDPVVWWFRTYTPFAKSYERQDALVLPKGMGKKGILCSLHGDKGIRGGRTRSTAEFQKINQRTTLGHNHSAIIQGSVWRVGTSTPRMQFYVEVPETNWTNTHLVIFANGQRQLVSIVKGGWYGCK